MKKYFGLKLLAFCLLLSAFCFLFSCSHSEFSDYEKTESGLMYKFHKHGTDTLHAQYENVVRVKMNKRFNDSLLESTNSMIPEGIEQYLRKPAFPGAIEEGIHMMVIGDSATFLISTDSINKYYPPKDSTKIFEPNKYLAFDIKLENIKTMEEVRAEEEQRRKEFVAERKEKGPKELSQYIADNHIEAKPTASGLYLIAKEKGKGAMPKDEDTVVVHYTGTFLDGTIFDSSVKRNQPFSFVVNDKGSMGVIPGWNEAIKMMNKGTIATVILPHSLAYDSVGVQNPQSGKYFIPPYSPLKFDIQLIDIKSKK
ncbi:MAG: FKBP-type peptidyl-prolyl cis-trans isomerase [Bacteroidetes bacterium]|nr:FKBP-type peptidyl-prolyl cis-trans isomerase [Bacteroidota bacterium]